MKRHEMIINCRKIDEREENPMKPVLHVGVVYSPSDSCSAVCDNVSIHVIYL
jgi:hypothetical protein